MAQADQGTRTAEAPKPDMSQAGTRQAMGKVLDSARVATVFGEPVVQGDVTVIPVARVQSKGGGGGGAGPAQDGQTQRGRGGGFGLAAKPVGVFVVRSGKVSWRPSVDVNRIVMGGQIVAAVGILALRSVLRARRA
jgi:uncharacterized spore protein YtfJ